MKKQDIIKHIQLEMLDGGKDIEEIKNLTKDYHRLTCEALLEISDTHTQRYNRKFDEDVTTRTQKVIDQFKSMGKENEWDMLKGILLITCSDWKISDNIRFRNQVIDTGMIAGRMDEITKEQMAQYEADINLIEEEPCHN